jgi:hypothetical protein
MTLDNNYTLIYNIFRKIEMDIIKLAWGSLTTNTTFDDLLVDDLSSHSGINNTLSYYQYDPSYKYAYKTSELDLRLTTNVWTASLNNPASAFCAIEIYPPPEGYAVGEDIMAYISTNNGSNFEEFTNLYQIYSFQSLNLVYLKGEINSLTEYNDSQIVFKIQTANDQDIKVSAFALGVRY